MKERQRYMGIIEERRSIRRFTDEPVDREALIRMAKAGMHAACAYGDRAWEFLIVTERELLKKAAAVNPNCALAADAAAVIIPIHVPKKQRKPSDWWVEDMSACTENILLKITEEGLGGVWLGIYPRMDRVEYLRECFDIPDEVTPFAMIAVGHAADKGRDNDRETAEIHFERY